MPQRLCHIHSTGHRLLKDLNKPVADRIRSRIHKPGSVESPRISWLNGLNMANVQIVRRFTSVNARSIPPSPSHPLGLSILSFSLILSK